MCARTAAADIPAQHSAGPRRSQLLPRLAVAQLAEPRVQKLLLPEPLTAELRPPELTADVSRPAQLDARVSRSPKRSASFRQPACPDLPPAPLPVTRVLGTYARLPRPTPAPKL